MGTVHLLDGLWRQLGVDGALRQVLGARRFTTDVERVLFALVANRAVDPTSKLAAAEWVREDVVVCGLASMDEDQAYRAMDLLVEADAQAQVQEAVFFAVADLLNLEVDLLFFDTTSTYFERDTEEAPTEQRPAGGLRRYGHSKDSRPDLPQIIIGLAVTREGIPVRCWVWPGNTSDVSVLPEVKNGLRGWRLGRVVTVVDRGFSSAANLDYLRRAGGHWIAGQRMRDGNPAAQAALSRPGRYRAVRDNLRVKEVRLDDSATADGVGVRWIVCHNPVEAERDKTRRKEALARLTAELERIATARAHDAQRRKDGKKAGADSVHVRAECALRDHPTLGRWLRQLPSGRLVLDRAKIAAEERLEDEQLNGLRLQTEVEGVLAALTSATSVNADLINRPDLGRVQEGCVADLLVVNGNPIEKPTVLWSLSAKRTVIQGGVVVQ